MPPENKYRHHKYRPKPGDPHRPNTVRGAYIYNLVDCLQTCLLRRDLDRARRAWAILVRCPDVHWHDLWLWGLYLLTDGADKEASSTRFSQHESGAEGERYLRSLQVAAKESEKPVILAELVQHLIREGRYRAALEELQTYLTAFTYLSSAPLLTYAGLVCFYLAHPESARGGSGPTDQADEAKRAHGDLGDEGSDASSSRSRSMSVDLVADAPPNPAMMKQAREWFGKALKIDPQLTVAKEFAAWIDGPSDLASDDEMELNSDDGRTADRSWREISDEGWERPGKAEDAAHDDYDNGSSDKWDSTDSGKSAGEDGKDDGRDSDGGTTNDPDADLWRLQRHGFGRRSSS